MVTGQCWTSQAGLCLENGWANSEFGQHRYNHPGLITVWYSAPPKIWLSVRNHQPSGQKAGMQSASSGLSPLGCSALKERKFKKLNCHLLYHGKDDISKFLEPVFLCCLQHPSCTAQCHHFILQVFFTTFFQESLDNICDCGLTRH